MILEDRGSLAQDDKISGSQAGDFVIALLGAP